MKWVSNTKQCWGHYSTHGLALATTIGGVWTAIPDDVKATFPHSITKIVGYIILLACTYGLIGKFIDQTPQEDSHVDPS